MRAVVACGEHEIHSEATKYTKTHEGRCSEAAHIRGCRLATRDACTGLPLPAFFVGERRATAQDGVATAYGRTVTVLITGGVIGLLMPPSSPRVVGVSAIASTVDMPLVTCAKIT